MFHEHAVEVHVQRADAVSRTDLADLRMQFDGWDAGTTLHAQYGAAVHITQYQNLTRINQMRVADLAAVNIPQCRPFPRAVQIFAGNTPQCVAGFDGVACGRIRADAQVFCQCGR